MKDDQKVKFTSDLIVTQTSNLVHILFMKNCTKYDLDLEKFAKVKI